MVNTDCHLIGEPIYIGLYECFYFGRYPLSNVTERVCVWVRMLVHVCAYVRACVAFNTSYLEVTLYVDLWSIHEQTLILFKFYRV